MHQHDGYEPHSHEVRPDHGGVRREPQSLPAMSPVDDMCYKIDVAARRALGNGIDVDTVASTLEDMAHAIRVPGDVAEDMSPIKPDDPDPDPAIVLNW